MKRQFNIVIDVDLGFLGTLLVLAVAVLAATGGSPARAEINQAPLLWTSPAPRSFYLTKTTHNGADADTACAGGYHMASLWEILDVSNLRYDTTLGYQHSPGDGGEGPPTGATAVGWVRTGNVSSVGTGAGNGNCASWSQTDGNGTAVALPNDWDSPGTAFGPWIGGYGACVTSQRVWCVQQPFQLYMPLVLRNG